MRWLDVITDSGHEFEQTQGDSEGQGGLVCCSPWACKELDTTERLNNSRCYNWCYEHQVLSVMLRIQL